MEIPDHLDNLEREELRELYDGAISHFQYQHEDVWRGQKYYTTLNTGIFGGAIALGRLESVGGVLDPRLIPLFFVGIVTSFLGYRTVKRLRRYWLQAGVKKTAIEYLLGYRREFSRNDVGTNLAISWVMEPRAPHGQGKGEKFESVEDIVGRKEEWIAENVRRRGVTYWFMNLQVFFLLLNLSMILLLVANELLF